MAVISEPKKIKDKLMIPEAGEEEQKLNWQKKAARALQFPRTKRHKNAFHGGIIVFFFSFVGDRFDWRSEICHAVFTIFPLRLPPVGAFFCKSCCNNICVKILWKNWRVLDIKKLFLKNSEELNTGYSQLFYFFLFLPSPTTCIQ